MSSPLLSLSLVVSSSKRVKKKNSATIGTATLARPSVPCLGTPGFGNDKGPRKTPLAHARDWLKVKILALIINPDLGALISPHRTCVC